MDSKINVAISVTISKKASQSIWSNGANQHAFFMYMMFKQMPGIGAVWIVSDIKREDFTDNMFIKDFRDDIYEFDQVADKIDLLVEMSAYINADEASRIRKNGGKLVSYKFGNDYVLSVENLSLGMHMDWVPHPSRIMFDEVWTNQQHVNTCLSYFTHLYKAPVKVLPHVWAPYFIEEALTRNSQSARGWPYQGRPEKAIISLFEPNINVVKSSLIPFYAASKFHDDNPGVVSNIYMLNTLRLVDNPLFSRIVTDTEAGKSGIASAEKRMPFVDFIGQHGGIIMTHQWENGLNYLYYEALYGGFPLVHNSPFLKNVGYFYPEFDIDAAADAIALAWATHDENIDCYNEAALAHLETISPYSESVIEAYAERVDALVGRD